MTITRLPFDGKLPFDREALGSGDPVRVTGYMLELVRTLQGLLSEIVQVTNLIVDVNNGEAIYSKLKDKNGDYPIGTWRLIQVDDNWERQVRLKPNEWTFAGDFERPL